MTVDDFIRKSKDGQTFTRKELEAMLAFAPDSPESYRIMAEANRISKTLTGNKAEVHAQFSLNLAPCAGGCKFCSFASVNKVFGSSSEITPEQAVEKAKSFESSGANAVFVMTTAHYPFERFIDMAREIRRNLEPETVLVANVGDRTHGEARRMKDAGFQGVYHALRLREGIDTNLDPRKRRQSIRAFQEAGLQLGTCVEPVGPEHTDEELAEMILFTGSFYPSYSGAARRIGIPGSELAVRGMITELRLAQIVAVTRLGVPGSVQGLCVHEPSTLGAFAGANLFWAESGANPRDVRQETEHGRGATVHQCRELFREVGWGVLEGPSRYYATRGSQRERRERAGP